MKHFIYPALLIPDKKDGGFVVRFSEFPEAITQGETIEGSLQEAADCLEEAIANRMIMGLEIPKPSRIKKGQHPILLPAHTAAKAALYVAIGEAHITKVELARRLHCNEREVRRLLDPHHPSKLPRIESALAAMGRRLVVSVQSAA